MDKLYKYTGTISGFSFDGNGCSSVDFILRETGNDDKSPIRLQAHGALAQYIERRSMTDAEERYIDATWVYDSNLYLDHIEIPSTNERRPAKVICNAAFLSKELVVFGPQEYIETSQPDPMSAEQATAWFNFRYNQ